MKLENYINGAWEEPAGLPGQSLCDASSGDVIGKQANSNARQIEDALAAAKQASTAWASMDLVSRAALLNACADALEARKEEIAFLDSRQTGVLLRTTMALSALCPAAFRAAAQLLESVPACSEMEGAHGPVWVERLPLGPAAIVAPWNAPSGIACHKLASALAAACPALYKPSEWAQASAQVITQCLAGVLPEGVIQLIHGDGQVGAELVGDPRIAAVSFTGGLPGGQAVARACAVQMKPAQLELGGSNPLVVLPGADLEAAVEGIMTGLTTLNGQWCRALGRLLVHESLQEELLDRLAGRLASLNIGPASSESSDMGPMVHAGHRDHLEERVQALQAGGGKLLRPSAVESTGGWYFAPTLVTGLDPDQTREELFGPVAFVHGFETSDEAVRLANGTPFGLAAYVFGPEPEAGEVASGIRAGIVKINGVSMLNLNPAAPRPAWGLSGLGDEGTRESFEFFRGTRVSGAAGPAPGDST